MATTTETLGVTGALKADFAFPAKAGGEWRRKAGHIVFKNGFTVDLQVEGEHIPRTSGQHGISVTYHVLKNVRAKNGDTLADVTRLMCRDGVLVDVTDVASDVKLLI